MVKGTRCTNLHFFWKEHLITLFVTGCLQREDQLLPADATGDAHEKAQHRLAQRAEISVQFIVHDWIPRPQALLSSFPAHVVRRTWECAMLRHATLTLKKKDAPGFKWFLSAKEILVLQVVVDGLSYEHRENVDLRKAVGESTCTSMHALK